jgi:hypothetical protein
MLFKRKENKKGSEVCSQRIYICLQVGKVKGKEERPFVYLNFCPASRKTEKEAKNLPCILTVFSQNSLYLGGEIF